MNTDGELLMGAGKYNQRISVYRNNFDPANLSSLNEAQRTQELVASVWAFYNTNPGSSLLFPRGRESFQLITDQQEQRFIFLVRYLGKAKDINKFHRVLFRGLNYDVAYTKQLFLTTPPELEIHCLLMEGEADNP